MFEILEHLPYLCTLESLSLNVRKGNYSAKANTLYYIFIKYSNGFCALNNSSSLRDFCTFDIAADKVSCSRTHHSESAGGEIRN